jgi:hypothetical protein
VKRSEVKRSEVVHIQGRGSSYYVATSYRLDGPGSSPCSILVYSVFFSVFCFLCSVMFMYLYCTYVYVLYSTVDVDVLVLYCENSCDVLCCFRDTCCFLVEYMVCVNTATGHKPNCS